MKQLDLHWLAGLLEGEGCFSLNSANGPYVKLAMTDREPVERAALLMGSESYVAARKTLAGKPVYITELSGAKRVRELISKLHPLMSPRRRKQIEGVIFRCNNMEDDYISGFQKSILIKYLVNEKGLSQTELSNRTGIGLPVINSVVSRGQKRMGRLGAQFK